MGTETEVTPLTELYKGYTIELKQLGKPGWYGFVTRGAVYCTTVPRNDSIPAVMVAGRAWIDNCLQEVHNASGENESGWELRDSTDSSSGPELLGAGESGTDCETGDGLYRCGPEATGGTTPFPPEVGAKYGFGITVGDSGDCNGTGESEAEDGTASEGSQ